VKIKIWSQDDSDEENADEIEVDSPEDLLGWFWVRVERAVLEYAEADHPKSDYWEQGVFCVRAGEVLKTYDVQVVMEPAFQIAERRDHGL